MARGIGRSSFAAALVVGVLVLVSGGLWARAFTATSAPTRPAVTGSVWWPTATPTAVAGAPRLVTLGDVFTAGGPRGGLGPAGWPARVATALGYELVNRAAAGSGYVAGDQGGAAFASQLDAVVAARPRLVIVAGGYDRDGQVDVGPAAASLFSQLRSRLPGARVVVIGVIAPNSRPPADAVAANNTIRAAAQANGLAFVDPLAENWLNASMINPDDLVPTDAGHEAMAFRIFADLGRLGITRASPSPSPSTPPTPGRTNEPTGAA